MQLAGRQLGAVQFVDSTHGWVLSGIGPDTRVFRTIDGGATWIAGSAISSISYAVDLRFADRCVGWVLAVSDGGTRLALYGTADAGQTWREQLTRPNPSHATGVTAGLGMVEVPEAGHVYVAADAVGCTSPCWSELLETTDLGATWHSLHAFGTRVSTMRFANARNGWAITYEPTNGSAPTLESTSDGGLSWTAHALPPFADQIELTNASDGWALGRDGAWCTASSCSRWYLYRTSDGGATWSTLHDSDDIAKAAWWLPNPHASAAGFLSGPHFIDTTHGWIVLDIGAGGAGVRIGGVITTSDGGVTWQQSGREPYPKDLKGVSFIDAQTGWASSGSVVKRGTDQLFRTRDSGNTWEPVFPSLESDLSRVRTAVAFTPWIPGDAPRPGLTATVRLPTEATVGNPSLVIEYRSSPVDPIAVQVLEGPAGCCLDATRTGQPLDIAITPTVRGQLIPNQAQFGGPILWWDASAGTGPATYLAIMSSVLTTAEMIAFARSFVPLP